MHVFVPILIAVAVIVTFIRLHVVFKDKIDFYTKGADYKFQFNEISALWKLAKKCELDNPIALYVSEPALNTCIMKIIDEAQEDGSINNASTQKFLSKLYDFRTRVKLESENHKGIQNTRFFSEGQRVRVILKGKGVFASQILNCAHELVLALPRQYNEKTHRMTILEGDEWKGKEVSVYLWRKGDASYAFDTTVIASNMFRGERAIYLRHTDKIDRAQKRQSIRAPCQIYASMYIITKEPINYEFVDEAPGFRCLLEDISEDGAMIRVGGKGKKDIQIKLQFSINDFLVMMFGSIRAVEYNETLDQSRLHFECTHIAPSMKNAVLGYVYNIVPEEEKDKHEAIIQSEKDSKDEENETGLENTSESDKMEVAEEKLEEVPVPDEIN